MKQNFKKTNLTVFELNELYNQILSQGHYTLIKSTKSTIISNYHTNSIKVSYRKWAS